ncbi:MAG: SPOR domain-containing protein [Methylococcaceae bacterium]
MNQELTQRLIGAVVVTALAAIFIPMLFDDPIDDSSQAVSELSIPKEPVVTIDGTADKLPDNANQVLQAPDTESEQSDNNQDMSSEPLEKEDMVDVRSGQPDNESELEQSKENVSEETLENNVVSEEEELGQSDNDVANDLPAQEESPGPLDTGVVKETSKVLKRPEKSSPKQIEPVTKPKKTVKKPEISPSKQTSTAKPLAITPVKPASKPLKSSPELVRWYIQAGSFNKKENALSLLENLRKQGLPVSLETVRTGEKGALYRLKVGPELDKKRAASMKAKLDKQNIQNILIAE